MRRSSIIVLLAALFTYFGPPVLAAVEGQKWSVSQGYLILHVVPGATLTIVALYQIARERELISRLSAALVIALGLLIFFGPPLAPFVGISKGFQISLNPILYHFLTGAVAIFGGWYQLTRETSATATHRAAMRQA